MWEIIHPLDLNETEVSPERADELKDKVGHRNGQLWRCERHKLICGDSTNPTVLVRLWSDNERRLRMVLADSPYGVYYGEKRVDQPSPRRTERRPIENDSLKPKELQLCLRPHMSRANTPHRERRYMRPCRASFSSILSRGSRTAAFATGTVWGGSTELRVGPQRLSLSPRTHPLRLARNGPHYFTDDRTQIPYSRSTGRRLAICTPTTKPIALIARMVANSSRPGEPVYDPFGGTGLHILAAHQLGRICYGVEIDPGMSQSRWSGSRCWAEARISEAKMLEPRNSDGTIRRATGPSN